ncbi:response regulator [Leptolyngbya sp. FACHB-671]|uniref:ATP-binding protein n=1 Tax=Leptolyngbya sp. FACHB-671 TaxID=2692812 RepID=UPI001685BBEA|nr:ATP-binding protein [Leptolyngbya sp. FACHB-671]MBD2072198.1 response regulator [Leptolyngbya sp. FACHB-671]
MNQHSNLSTPEPSAPHGQAPSTELPNPKDQLETQLWLERHSNQLTQQINNQLLRLLSRDRPLQSGQKDMIAAELFHIVVNELRAALGNGVVAIALPWHDPDSRFDTTPSPSTTVFQVCHVAPLESRRHSQPANASWLQGLQARLSPGETLFLQDFQQGSSDWQTAWKIQTSRGLVGWLIVSPATLPDAPLLHQAWLDLIERVVQQCAIAISQIQLLQLDCPQCHKLENRIRELERINQLKSEFLASTSHEIRTPLNSMLGFVQLLHQNHSSDLTAHQDYLNTILSSGQYLLALVNDILDLSKVEADRLDLQRETVHVPDLCHNLMTLIAEKAHAKGLQLRIDLDSSVTTFVADPLRLKQMLLNLLSNAVKFTPSGTVGLRVNLVGVFLHFSVWDTGAGISKEQQAKLFRPYTHLNEVVGTHEGTGLGLAVSQKLAQLHGGRIEVHSELNHGSQFTLVLPLTPAVGDRQSPPETPTPEISRPTPPSIPSPRPTSNPSDATHRPTVPISPSSRTPPPTLGKPILVVEDNVSSARLILTYLAKLGYQVLWAKNPEEFWVCLKNTLPALILMDVGLPDVDGLTLIKQLRANPKYKSIPVVVQTAMVMAGDRETCLQAGAAAYLPKPVALDVLARLVANYSSPKTKS